MSKTRSFRAETKNPVVCPIRDNRNRITNHLFYTAVSGISVKACVRATEVVLGWRSLPPVELRPSCDPYQDPARSADRLLLLGTGLCSQSRAASEAEVRTFRSRRLVRRIRETAGNRHRSRCAIST